MNNRESLMFAAALLQIAMQREFGREYDERVSPYRERLRNERKSSGRSTIDCGKSLLSELKGDSLATRLAAAALADELDACSEEAANETAKRCSSN